MTSTDNQYLIELRSEVKMLETKIEINSAKIADLQYSIYLGFALTAFFIMFIGSITIFLVTFAPRIWAILEQKSKSGLTEQRVREMIDASNKKGRY